MSIKGIRTRDGIEMFDFLPLTGGTSTGDITIDKTSAPKLRLKSGGGEVNIYKNANETVNYGTIIADSNNDGTNLQFNINCASNTKSLIRAVMYPAGGTAKAYAIFGEHNKPVGTYTGNGDATQRQIDTGGIGNICMITGNSYAAIVTANGAFYTNASGANIATLATSAIKFYNGVLTIASTSPAINGNGKTYTYQVL